MGLAIRQMSLRRARAHRACTYAYESNLKVVKDIQYFRREWANLVFYLANYLAINEGDYYNYNTSYNYINSYNYNTNELIEILK